MYVRAEGGKPRLRLQGDRAPVGGQTLANLRSYHNSQVAANIRAFLSRIIARTAAPLDLMLLRWAMEGVVVDPHGENYIVESPTVAAAAAKASVGLAFMHASEGLEACWPAG